jgi:cytochrome c oxidase accessory protein FixG
MSQATQAPLPASTPQTQHQRRGSIQADGRRVKVRIGDVKGRFTTLRRWIFWSLIAFYAVLPLLKIRGQPVVFLDIVHRRFYLFGGTFNAQDAYLLWPFLAGGLFTLFLLTALFGRVWCGYACPQTVFMEGIFRRLERWLEGPKHLQVARARGPWTWDRIWRSGVKHGLFALATLLVSHIFISYFVSLEQLAAWVTEDPREHLTAFLWMASIAGVLYLDFAWFREQTCLILCPYGRLQSALTDDDTITVTYDPGRGEPRGKVGTPGAGDCVNCLRCVDVCPTAIDIREGLQLECIACASCIDACDDIMRRLGRSPGLIRYDSLSALNGRRRRRLRPRILLHLGLLVALSVIGGFFIGGRHPFEATLIRQEGAPYFLDRGLIRNQYFLHVVNKTPQSGHFEITLEGLPPKANVILPVKTLRLPSLGDIRLPVNVELPQEAYRGEFEVLAVTRERESGKEVRSSLRFVGP